MSIQECGISKEGGVQSKETIADNAQLELLKMLKQSGVKLDRVAPWAAKRKDRSLLRKLSDAGVDVDSIGPNGFTALTQAVLSGDRKTVEMLVELGACVTQEDRFGKTPEKYARLTRRKVIGQILRRHKFRGEWGEEGGEGEGDTPIKPSPLSQVPPMEPIIVAMETA